MTDAFTFSSMDDFDVINTFSVVQLTIQAAATSPEENWVVGSFRASQDFTTKFSVVGGVAASGITGYVKVYEISDDNTGFLGAQVTISSEEIERQVSSESIDFKAGRIYQFRARAEGGSADTDYLFINSILLETA